MAGTLQSVNHFPGSYKTVISDPREKQEYLKLFDLISKVQGLLEENNPNYQTNRSALAFLVAAARQTEPEAWLSRLEEIRKKVQEYCQQPNPAAEVSWYIYKIVMSAYEPSLKQRNLERQLKILASYSSLYEANHTKGLAISFGAIDKDDVPRWLITI